MEPSDELLTCGQGVAAHAVFPAKLGELIAALADTLERHMTALDLGDDAALQEHAAYAALVDEHRAIAARLQAAAANMAGQRDLPMGAHDDDQMAAPEVRAAFARFVAVEEQLAALLADAIDRDRTMLARMGPPSAAAT